MPAAGYTTREVQLQKISARENTIYYHIAQFIIAEYHKKTVVFS